MKISAPLAACLGIALAAAANAEPISPSLVRGMPVWSWSSDAAPGMALRIDLVRADVTVVPSRDGRISVTLEAEGSPDDAARVWIDVSRQGGAVVVGDRFPIRPPWTFPTECLPPPDERGDFWLVSTRLRVVVAVPKGVVPTIVIKDRWR